MPRPARRTRAVVRTKEPEATSASTTATADPITTETDAASTSPPAPTRRTRRSDAAPVSQTPSAGSRRTSSRHAAVASAAAPSTSATASASSKSKAPARPALPARGPDVSGLHIMDDTFADIDTNFGDHTLRDLSDLENLDDLDADLDAFGGSPGAAAPTADTTAASTSSFNVGLFRRGRPRQSSVHSRDDAPIRPSSRGGNSSAATPSMGSSFSLGTFKRRAREPSILGRHRRARDESRGPSRDASREPSRMHSRHTSRDRGAESGSELDDTAVTAPQYMSDAESSSVSNTRGRASKTTRSRAPQAAPIADTSVSSSANTTTMLLMGRTRTRAAAAPKPTTTTASRKRKSQEGQRENELPKRQSRGVETAETTEVQEAVMGDAADAAGAAEPLSDISIVPSVEASELADVADVDAAVAAAGPASSPLSSPASSSASVRLSEAELRRRYTTPGGPNDEIMAPPMSSDSESETPPMWPTLKGLTKGVRRGKTAVAHSVPTLSRQTPELVDDEIASDISSPPSLTHSPNYQTAPAKKPAARGRTAPARGQTQKEVAPLTTAALAALLPQRHRRSRPDHHRSGSHEDEDDENEFERSALLSEDDDELAHHAKSFSGASLRRGRSASGLRATAQAQAQARGKTADDSSKNKKRRRTYGSRGVSGASDKENQDNSNSAEDAGADDSTFTPLAGDTFGDDDTTQVLPSTSRTTARAFGEELEKAAIKFKEVDKWSLEYESVTRSSSPVDAR
ncbi:hypothetical protein F503_03486 [Ophiostoma piceae UAMH 11346]|uniref:Uncharacterized protein n=1 Tax=Ophiostoma piceae (strain UAMH 11346) TaxID=1262450 RepID=S3C0I7_OPHP1|nr:hypothetical protein F503_03486 [Ophiostoma piceae UAMH 11346]